ncbi:MAG: stress response translation initiation inhibitor YciH [Candidatus Anstonellales archaeon]
MALCPKCGLPTEICACSILEKEEVARIRIYSTKKRFKKLVTIIEGLEKSKMHEAAKKLKKSLACGGTEKEGMIILQGNHEERAAEILEQMGYPKESIRKEGFKG